MAALKSLILIMSLATLLLVATTTARDLHEQKIGLDDHKGGIDGEGLEEERGLFSDFSKFLSRIKRNPTPDLPKTNSKLKSKWKLPRECEFSDDGGCPYGKSCYLHYKNNNKCAVCCGLKI